MFDVCSDSVSLFFQTRTNKSWVDWKHSWKQPDSSWSVTEWLIHTCTVLVKHIPTWLPPPPLPPPPHTHTFLQDGGSSSSRRASSQNSTFMSFNVSIPHFTIVTEGTSKHCLFKLSVECRHSQAAVVERWVTHRRYRDFYDLHLTLRSEVRDQICVLIYVSRLFL